MLLEAGLSLQSTLNRVSDEVRPISMDLYHELHLTNAELRTGISRETALKNMGERTGVQSVNSLVGMMIQSEKMGTSMSQALRVHSSFLRVQRSQKAEAIAAKLPVKIMFPMMAFIFPAIFVVVLGPAAINLLHSCFFPPWAEAPSFRRPTATPARHLDLGAFPHGKQHCRPEFCLPMNTRWSGVDYAPYWTRKRTLK